MSTVKEILTRRPVVATVRLTIPAGGARPGPTVGPAVVQYKIKQADTYCQYMSLEAISKSIIGTANSMGIKVQKDLD